MEETKQKPPSEDGWRDIDMSVGEVLRRSRQKKGQSLRDVEQNLRIRACQIQAIEEDDFEKLPGRVYTIGFVRSYAEYLGLDGERVVTLLKKQFNVRVQEPTLDFPVAASDSKVPHIALIALCVVMSGIVVYFGSRYFAVDRQAVEEVLPISENLRAKLPELDVAETHGTQVYGPSLPEGYQPPAVKQPNVVILDVIANCWVEIRDAQNNVLVSRVLKAGERYSLPEGAQGLVMSLGNAGGIELEIAGQSYGALGAEGEVKKALPLDIDVLKQNYAQKS